MFPTRNAFLLKSLFRTVFSLFLGIESQLGASLIHESHEGQPLIPFHLKESTPMLGHIFNNVCVPLFNEDSAFFGHQLEGYTEKYILLREMWNGPNQDTTHIVLTTSARDGIDIEKQVAITDVRDGERLHRGRLSHCKC
jgi:hypothetical protein